MSPSPAVVANDGYADLAPLYDELVAHPRYRHWILAIEAAAREVGVNGVRLLDVGCGTGRSFAPLLERGYLVTGCEPVAAMLAAARRRSPRRVRIVPGLASELPDGPFDLVLALNDVVNSLPDEPELVAAFCAVAGVMAPGAVFAFDITPRGTYDDLLGQTSRRRTARAEFGWRPLTRPPLHDGGVVAMRLTARSAGRTTHTLHRQRHHEHAVVERALAAAGLRVARVLGCDNDGTLTASSSGSFKHIVLAQS